MTRRIIAPVLAMAWLATASPAVAQNREHVQMAAELRILQEQTQQLALTLAQLGQALTALNARLEAGLGEVSDTTQKGFADQRLVVTELANDLRVVRERTQENNARVGTLREELEALRQAVMTRPAPAPVAPAPPMFDPFGPAPGTQPSPGSSSSGDPSGGGAPAPGPAIGSANELPPSPTGNSPERMFRAAWADYTSGQYTLAIIGFEQFVRSFPQSERADEAQLLIGDSHYQMNRFREAISAYNQVIQNYPAGRQIAAAYYKRGLAESQLGMTDAARASWAIVLDRYPNSDVAGLARQGIQRLGDQSSR